MQDTPTSATQAQVMEELQRFLVLRSWDPGPRSSRQSSLAGGAVRWRSSLLLRRGGLTVDETCRDRECGG